MDSFTLGRFWLLLHLRPNYISSASNDIHTDGPRARAMVGTQVQYRGYSSTVWWVLKYSMVGTQVQYCGYSSTVRWILKYSMVGTQVQYCGYSSTVWWVLKYSKVGILSTVWWVLKYSTVGTQVQ